VRKVKHSEWVSLVVSNEERIDLPKERYHQQQEHIERGRSWSHQQSRKLLGLGDTAAFSNRDNWCLLTWEKWLGECGRGRQ
jgi:hypothetical protein